MGHDCQVALDSDEEQKKDLKLNYLRTNIAFRDTRVKKDCPDYENWKSYFFEGGYLPFEPGRLLNPIIFTINY